jgi:hypothetical protein
VPDQMLRTEHRRFGGGSPRINTSIAPRLAF